MIFINQLRETYVLYLKDFLILNYVATTLLYQGTVAI